MQTGHGLKLFVRLTCQAVASLLAGLISIDVDCQGAEKLPELDFVRSCVREYLSAIESIDVEYQHWSTMWPDGKPHPGECGPQDAEWAEQGSQRLLKIGPYPNEGLTPFQTFISFDGKIGYFVDYEPSDISKVRSIQQTPRINKAYPSLLFLSPAAFYGRRISHWDGTLLDLLSSPAARVIAHEEIEGSQCLHLQVANLRGISDMEISYDAWLDEGKDYLPRLAVSKVVDPAPKWAHLRDSEWRFEIKEFLEVEDTLLGQKRWFPAVMAHADPYGTFRLKVKSVALNIPLPLEKFRPDIPRGTVVYDGDPIPFTRTKSFIAGGADATTALIDQRLEEATRLPSPPGPLVDARQERSVNWNVVVGGLCLVVLAGIVIWRFTVRR